MGFRDPLVHVAALLGGSVLGGATAAHIANRVAEAIVQLFFGADDRVAALKQAYEMLGISADATDAELKARYQYLAARTHPDRGGDPERFALLRAAYEFVSETRRPPRSRL